MLANALRLGVRDDAFSQGFVEDVGFIKVFADVFEFCFVPYIVFLKLFSQNTII